MIVGEAGRERNIGGSNWRRGAKGEVMGGEVWKCWGRRAGGR